MKQSVKLALGAVAVLLLVQPGPIMADEKVTSLRGDVPLAADAVLPTSKDWQAPQKELIERNFADQPPLIPHATDGYLVTKDSNTCLTCHAKNMAAATGAPAPKESHYTDRDGNVLDEVSSARYFCNQCHVRQVAAEPLVENTYTPPAGE